VCRFERIRLRLFHDAEADGRFTVHAHEFAIVFRADLCGTHVLQPDRIAVPIGQNQLIELRRFLQASPHAHTELPLGAFDPAGGHGDVLCPERVFDVLHGEEPRSESVGIQPDAHRIPPSAVEHDAGDAGQGRESILQLPLGKVGHFEFGMPIADQRQPHDAVGFAVLLHDQRRFNALRKQVLHSRHAVAHVVGRRIQVTRQREFEADGR
jgi:hypothetical protein